MATQPNDLPIPLGREHNASGLHESSPHQCEPGGFSAQTGDTRPGNVPKGPQLRGRDVTRRIGDGDPTTTELMDGVSRLPGAQRLLEAAALSPRLVLDGASTYRIAAEQAMLDGRQALQAHYLALATHPIPATEENLFVLKVRDIVKAHLNDHNFDVALLCREVGMSNSNLHRKLTALTGHSSNQFIRYIRLSQACVLLRDHERTIAAVAYDCGFNDPVYFARAFRQEFGMAPSEWRSRNSGQV